MRLWKKTLSVGLSLVMCASLVAPGFAANFTDLQRAINGTDKYATNPFTAEDGSTRYGYGAGEGSSWEIEAWNTENEDGTVTRNVQLNEDVIRGNEKDDAIQTITIKDGKDVVIDLNGNDIDGNRKSSGYVVEIQKGGELTLTDSTGHTEIDEDGNETYESGAITGGKNTHSYNFGGGVTNAGTFTMEGGAIADNFSNRGAGGVYNTGTFTMEDGAITNNRLNGDESGGVTNTKAGTFIMNGGTISGNKTSGGSVSSGGGVQNKGTFIMNDGTISGNTSVRGGGGVDNWSGTFTMNGGTISGNTTSGSVNSGGGGVYNDSGTFIMNDGTISGNTSKNNGGGVCIDYGKFIMTGGTISDNTAAISGGGVRGDYGTLTITGGTISDNEAGSAGDEISSTHYTTLTIPEDSLWDHDSNPYHGKDTTDKVYLGTGSKLTTSVNYDLREHTHTFTIKETTPPTCTEDGKVVYSGCSCGQTVTETIKALGHEMGEWRVTRYATSDEDGEERSDCQREGCGYFETRPTSVTDPDLEKPDPEDPDSEKPDPEKPDPEKPDPVNPDPEKPDPEKPDPEKPDPEKPDPEKPDPEKPDPEKPDPEKPDPEKPAPVNPDPEKPAPVNPDPEKPDPVNPDPEELVDIEDPETPLGELPDEVIDIEDPDTPLAELPEEPVEIDEPEVPLAELPEIIDIDDPAVPLGDVPQTGEASTAMWLAVLLACGMGLVYVNTGKRKENA